MGISEVTKAWVFECIYGRLRLWMAETVSWQEAAGHALVCADHKSALSELHASWDDARVSTATKATVRRILEWSYEHISNTARSHCASHATSCEECARFRAECDRVADELEASWTMPKVDRHQTDKQRPELRLVQ